MEIQQVVFKNFKPYFEANEIDLTVNPEQNIVLIGGRNGQGKTSFLVGLVWCIYGERITRVDKIFSNEVKGGYPRFLQSALNRRAAANGIEEFSVSVTLNNVELSDIFMSDAQKASKIQLIRSYNVQTGKEDFSILIDGQPMQLVNDDEGKANFVNDYLIPIEAAKFVFFDAEKISEIAEMNIKDQGRVMNDALGKILGLSKYEDLVLSLSQYIKDLKSKNTKGQLSMQIDTVNNRISLDTDKLTKAKIEEDELEEKIAILHREIAELDGYLARSGAKSTNIDVNALESKKLDLEKRQEELGNRLKETAEQIPFAISAGKIQELVETLKIEQTAATKQNSLRELRDKAEQFVDILFEQPPFPLDKQGGDMKTLQKAFYIGKAREVFEQIYINTEGEEINLPFQHDLNKATVDHIEAVYERLKKGEDSYQTLFTDYIRYKNDLNDINQQLNRAKAKADDSTVQEFKESLREKQQERDRLLRRQGEVRNAIVQVSISLENANTMLQNYLDKVELSKKDQVVIDDVNRHIAVLNQFIDAQKNSKRKSLAKVIKDEMLRIMHKKDLFDDVEVEIIPNNGGLEVVFLRKGQIISKEDFGSGEKQIYISCLLKAILEEAITDYPVLIDTPLGRLDKEHKDGFVDKYYPFLANQVIILTTDEEVTVARKERIKDKIANTYHLVNQNDSTQILNGYF